VRINRFRQLRSSCGVAGIFAVATAASVSLTMVPASPAQAAAASSGPVSSTPASGTPQLVKSSSTQRIRQLVQCGGTIYAVGKFSQISWNGTTFQRSNVFSFSATSPYKVTSWNPGANAEADSIALSSNCATAYIGGRFTSVNHTSADHLASVNASTGAVKSGWGRANDTVDSVLLTPKGHLLVGGFFTSLNGSTSHQFYASLNPATGKDDGYLNLKLSGNYHYCNGSTCSSPNHTSVYNQQLSHNGKLVLVEGIFTSAGGKARQQIFMLNLGNNVGTVTPWTSPEFDGSKGNLPNGFPYQCSFNEPFYIQAAAWSPSDSTIYTVATGKSPWNIPSSGKRSGLCDATAAFPAKDASVTHTWIDYTGCDSLYSVAADASTVYVAGHPRWAQNANQCNGAGQGAITDHGLQGLLPANGNVRVKSNGKAVFSMSRANADDMLRTSAGLWIASTNRFGMDVCGHKSGHAGICFLPN
jgi:hypothetical protein